jgi:hypothetical protein
MLIGVDDHPSCQQIAFLVKETGECSERRLDHSDGEAEKFYRDLQESAQKEANKTTRRSAWRSIVENSLTEPTRRLHRSFLSVIESTVDNL